MIVKEEYKIRVDGVKLFHIYSDEGKQILQNETGVVYDEAIDVENAPYTYTESDEFIEGYSNEATVEDYQEALREMGVDV